MPTTIERLRERKKTLLERKAHELALQEQGQGDNMALFFVEEELLDVNAQLRALTPRRRAGGMRTTNSAYAADRQQYDQWLHADGADNGRERAAMYQAIRDCRDCLTERQREVFALWSAGVRIEEIGRRLGVAPSTISRTVARSKKNIRESIELTGCVRKENGAALLDVSEPDTARAVLACTTTKQAVCLYLYYGEGLSLRETAALTGTDHTAVLMMLRRGLGSISERLGYQWVELDNLEALGDMALSLYQEGFEPPPGMTLRRDRTGWGRASLKETAPKKRAPPPVVTVRAERSAGGEPGKLLTLLRERYDDHWIPRCLSALFMKVKASIQKRREKKKN